jgi:hypothetical protein
MLPEEQQIAFWRSESKGRLQIQNALVKEVVSQREEEQRTSVGGKYLPLDVWARKGFDPEKIKNECTDTEEHAMFGTCYNVGLKTVTTDDITKKVWKDLFKACGDESPKKKKDTKKKKTRSSSSSSSSSSKASSSAPKLSVVEKRKAEAAKRKAAVAATKEQERLEKVAKAAAEKAAKEAEKNALIEAKEKQKIAMDAQATYSKLFAAHAKLMTDCHVVPMEKQSSTDYDTAMEKLAEGECIILECLDALKEKSEMPHEEVKVYIQSLRSVTSALAKLMPKKTRR